MNAEPHHEKSLPLPLHYHQAVLLPWMVTIRDFRARVFASVLEPVVVALLGPVVVDEEEERIRLPLDNDDRSLHFLQLVHGSNYSTLLPDSHSNNTNSSIFPMDFDLNPQHYHRRLGFLPSYVSNVKAFKETTMSFATLMMLFVTMFTVFLVFLSCFYHNQKTSPLFISPRRHRLPKLVPPPLPVDGYFSWMKICFYLSDEEIINRIGYDSLIFLRFHRLALRCIVKMSVFSFVVLLPLNYTGGGHANAQDLKEYVGSLFFTDFLRFSMANVQAGSPRLWVHCFAAYLLTAIVMRELLREYATFNNIRHRYLLSREPHLRTVLVTNIPRHLRSATKIENYFKNVYPHAVKSVIICQNLVQLEKLVLQRHIVLSTIEKELLVICRSEKKKIYEQTIWRRAMSSASCIACGGGWGEYEQGSHQERLAQLYAKLEELNNQVEKEQRRRRRVMKMLDRMGAGEGAGDIDYVLASPFCSTADPSQRRILGLPPLEEASLEEISTAASTLPPSFSNSAANLHLQPPTTTIAAEDKFLHGGVQDGMGLYEEGDNKTQLSSNADDNRLRSRSPAAPGEVETVLKDVLDEKKKRKAFWKARRAITQYGRFNQSTSILGKPIHAPVEVSVEGTIEDHINEVTDKAFVVMRTFTAATIAIQSMHSSKPGSMQVSTAPEPRDILWNNIYMSKGAHRTRSYLGEFLVLLLITFYVVPMAMVSLLVSESALISSSPRLAQLSRASAFFAALIGLVQPLFIVGLQQLLPPLFIAIGRAEGITAFSEVQMRAFSRYFLFQVINVFLVTTIAGSIFDTVAIIIENPESAFEMLGNSLPRLSSFFITFITIKTFLGLGFELVRVMALIQATARFILFPNATLRMKRIPIGAMRAIDDPGWFPFHKILAQDMLVVVISVVFAVVAPLVTLPCALFCLCSRIVWTHHHLYVYESVFESGGQFWPKIFRRFVFGLIIAQMTITGQFFLKEARHEAYATIALMFLTYVFLRSTRARYDPTSSALPLEVATVMDISLRQDEEVELAEDEWRRRQMEVLGETGPGPVAMMSPREQDGDNGAFIGKYDPFQKAYVQPALRANPRARPEQPFPVAQLGPEDKYFLSRGSSESLSTDGSPHDSRATVRLKSMNQQDRRLVNRWWNDQLQRAGDQNVLTILIGEECGTLTISGPGMTDVELSEQPSFQQSHCFV